MMSLIKLLVDLLDCPPEYLSQTSSRTCLLAVSEVWLGQILQTKRLPTSFSGHPRLSDSQVAALLSDKVSPDDDWNILDLEIVPVKDWATGTNIPYEIDNTLSGLSEILGHVNQLNLTSQWRHSVGRQKRSQNNKVSWIEEVISQVGRLWGSEVHVITSDGWEGDVPDVDMTDQGDLVPLLCVILTQSHLVFVFDHRKISLSNMLNYTPSLLGDNQHKPLFLFYQIVNIYKDFHSKGLQVGEVSLDNFKVTPAFHLQLHHSISRSLVDHNIESDSRTGMSVVAQRLCDQVDLLLHNSERSSSHPALNRAINLWSQRKISNLDYLLFLNYLAGRRFGQPNNHPVVPWVADFTRECGGWRDLNKSKFRLNKGDQALDMTYQYVECEDRVTPHHVTAVLSEITYYTYMARVTDRSVLCNYVRPSWVPAEYPSSVKRLQQWSPDEAIPEFYMDASIFTSLHSDLPDLELPSWTATPKEFITWHSSILESDIVSKSLHNWIDLTFGYKLSGSAAVRSKNVCLDLVDGHTDLRLSGVLHLFSHPHPARGPRQEELDIPLGIRLDLEINDSDCESDLSEGSVFRSFGSSGSQTEDNIVMPTDYNPVAQIQLLENMASFCSTSMPDYLPKSSTPGSFIRKKSVKQQDMKILGCVAVELFLHKKYIPLGQHASLPQRFATALKMMKLEGRSLPSAVQRIIASLISVDTIDDLNAIHPLVTDNGLPPPSPTQLINHIMAPVPFPPIFQILHKNLSGFSQICHELFLLKSSNPPALSEATLTCSEFQVKLAARSLVPHLPGASLDDKDLVIPYIKQLTVNKPTSVLASWLLLDSCASVLGPARTKLEFLQSVVELYCNGSPTAKHVKLYHRSFLTVLMVRLKLKVFLENFLNILIEAVGGYKDLEWDASKHLISLQEESLKNSPVPFVIQSNYDEMRRKDVSDKVEEPFSEGEVFQFDGLDDLINPKCNIDGEIIETVAHNLSQSDSYLICPAKYTKILANYQEDKDTPSDQISCVAAESVQWLSHRLGPVLACRYLARNLLRMLSLCYYGHDGVRDTGQTHNDQRIRLSPSSVAGDLSARPVLLCLSRLVSLYGECLVLVQYLPYCWDLVSIAKKKISTSLEGGLLGCLAVLQSVIPILSDTVLMNELPSSFLAHFLVPLVQVVTSRRVLFTGGVRTRIVVLYKLLDVVYLIGLRIGEEMARSHLTPLVIGFFSAIDKVYHQESVECEDPAMNQVCRVLCPSVVYITYVAFYNLLGGGFLDASLVNLEVIKSMCFSFQSGLQSPVHRPVSYGELQGIQVQDIVRDNSSLSGSGNMIVVCDDIKEDRTGDHDLISRHSQDSSRQLKGNWLAYWEHEIGRDEKDFGFNLKQIKLQNFVGHSGGVRSLACLDNENSFLSGGKDKTVRLWSIRNMDGGEVNVSPQSLYSSHKKSVFCVGFLEGKGQAVSCDGVVHLWDPFVGSTVSEYEAGKGGSFCTMRALPSPSNLVVAATTDGLVRLIDTRDNNSGVDLRVGYGSAGLVRSLAVSSSGHQLSIGHSSGYISMMDLRTGKLRAGCKAHDGEVLTLTNVSGSHFVSTSLDQTASGWRWEDGRLEANLRSPPEPLHCVTHYQGEIIMGSTANRLIIQSSVGNEAQASVVKLKSDLLKGNLMQMVCLPLNRLLLLATDSGNIHLIC